MKNKDVVKYQVTVPYYYYKTSNVSVPSEIPEEDVEDLILKAILDNDIYDNYFESYDEGIDENRFKIDSMPNQDSPESEIFGNILKIENGEPKLEYINYKEIEN